MILMTYFAFLAWMGVGIFSLNFSKAVLISPIRCLSLKLAVFRRYLDMGWALGRGLGPRFLGCFLRCSTSIRFLMEASLNLYLSLVMFFTSLDVDLVLVLLLLLELLEFNFQFNWSGGLVLEVEDAILLLLLWKRLSQLSTGTKMTLNAFRGHL